MLIIKRRIKQKKCTLYIYLNIKLWPIRDWHEVHSIWYGRSIVHSARGRAIDHSMHVEALEASPGPGGRTNCTRGKNSPHIQHACYPANIRPLELNNTKS